MSDLDVALTPRKVQGFGWRPDLPDPRDHQTGPDWLASREKGLPDAVSLRPEMPPVYGQAQLGSCTANAIAAAIDHQRGRQGKPFITPSRLFVYYNERLLEGTVGSDSGAFIRDGFVTIAAQGVPPESDWPYDITRFAERPPDAAYANALNFQTLEYARAYRSHYYLRAILAAGRTIVFGFTVFSSFLNIGTDGVMPTPDPSHETVEGGHAVVSTGYRRRPAGPALLATGDFVYETRNSWTEGWGDGGYFYMPESVMLDRGMSDDFWVVRAEE